MDKRHAPRHRSIFTIKYPASQKPYLENARKLYLYTDEGGEFNVKFKRNYKVDKLFV